MPGPFEPAPLLAVGVSGGADSTALALLAAEWVTGRGGSVLALIVDHGLRTESAAEAHLTKARMDALGLAARVLTLQGLRRGPGLAARARAARLDALSAAAGEAGALHLLLGHHAGDQAETRLMRLRAGSGPAGLAGMAAVRETHALRVLRPLLGVPAHGLRAYLRAHGVGWIEDPSNADLCTTRGRLRAELTGPGSRGGELWAQARAAGAARTFQEHVIGRELAERAELSPLGYAVLSPGPVCAAALAALWQAVSGRDYPPPSAAIARIAMAPGPVTLAGLRLLPAGRLGPGWLLVREAGDAPVPAVDGAVWGRFRLLAADIPPGLTVAALGEAAAGLRRSSMLPAAVLRTLPAIWRGAELVAVPGLGWPSRLPFAAAFAFSPARPAAGASWIGGEAGVGCGTFYAGALGGA